MTLDELVDLVVDEITSSAMITNSLSPKEIERQISLAERWFYNNYKYAVIKDYYIVPDDYFKTDEFKRRRFIQMPDCVTSVISVRESRGGSRLGMIDRDITENKIIASELYLTPFTMDDLVMRTAQYAYWDLTKAYFLETINYNFNKNSKILKIMGRDPRTSVVITTYSKIEKFDLYEDELFIKYVFGKCKIQLAMAYSMWEFEQPYGKINPSVLQSAGEKDLQEVKEQIEKEDPPNYFAIF